MTTHRVVSREEWIGARRQHLAREEELTRLRDQLSQERRDLPWEKVDKPYVFDGPGGPESLADLFAGRGQLIVQHFMFDPSWSEGLLAHVLCAPAQWNYLRGAPRDPARSRRPAPSVRTSQIPLRESGEPRISRRVDGVGERE